MVCSSLFSSSLLLLTLVRVGVLALMELNLSLLENLSRKLGILDVLVLVEAMTKKDSLSTVVGAVKVP